MRHLSVSVVFLFCVLTSVVRADDAPARDATRNASERAATDKRKVTFDGETLVLAWEGRNDEAGETTREFIPADQTLDRWTKLASIREYPDLDDPRALAELLARMVKEKFPDSQSSISSKSESDETIVDFVLRADDRSFVEFNVFKYRKGPEGGTIAEQYAIRDYTDPEAFLKDLQPLRDRLVELMAVNGLQLDR